MKSTLLRLAHPLRSFSPHRERNASFRKNEGPFMVSITGLNIFPSANLARARGSDAIEAALLQSLNKSNPAPGAADGSASGAGAATNAPTGFTAAPRLSADVIGALIASQSQQSAGSTSGNQTTGQASSLSGASAAADQPPASSHSLPGPRSLQDIAGQFDLHHLTHQQEEQLEGEFVSSGALSQKDGFAFFDKTVLSDAFNSQHYHIVNGQFVATTPTPPGTIIGNDAPGGQQYDVIQRFQQSLAADQYFGDSQNAAEDQKIVGVLNQLDSTRNASSA